MLSRTGKFNYRISHLFCHVLAQYTRLRGTQTRRLSRNLVAMDSFEMSTYRLSSDCSSSELQGYDWFLQQESNL